MAGISLLTQQADAEFTGGSDPRAEGGATAIEPRGRAIADVPLASLPARHAREITLPVPAGFTWPRFEFIAFYEHSGEEREAHARAGACAVCSVADRRS